MPWPTVTVSTTGMDSDSDTLPRADIKQMADNVNAIKDMRGVANGIASLGADSKVPAAQLPASVVEILPGMIIAYGGASAPSGWLLCAGQAVSRSTYSALYAIIGTAFGAGDGSTTFNLPDLRGRAPIGKDNMNGSDAGRVTSASTFDGDTLGAAGGAQTHTLTTAQLASHSHANTLTDPGHLHNTNIYAGTAGTNQHYPNYGSGATSTPITTSSAATGITITNANAGSGSAHNNMPPSLVVNWIIKT